MAIVGSAEIVVRAITNKVKDDIQKGLRDAQPIIAQEGQKAGESFSRSFGEGSSSNLGKDFEDSLRRANLGGVAENEGRDTGSSFMHGVEDEVDRGGRDVEQKAASLLHRAGKSGGDGFFSGFVNSDFGKSAGKASEAFTQLIGAGNLLGPAIAGLVGLVGSAASGLFAMGAAASQAAGALAVLPGIMAVAAQALGTLKLAFSGVGNAISAGFKQATASTTSTKAAALGAARSVADAQTAVARASQAAAQATIQANQRVADAATALSRARQAAVTSYADATRQVADAEAGVAAAQRTTLAAQNALNGAREEGVKQLRDLAFSAEDAGLAEEQAGIDLQNARKKLEEAQNLPPDDQARVQAELAFKQADLNFREAKARNQDLQAEEKKAAKAGVDGTDAVVSAKKKINDAVKSQGSAEKTLSDARRSRQQTEVKNHQSIADAEKALGDARAARAQTEIKNQQSVADAQLRLNRALQDQATALNKGTSAANAYQTALAKLSPPARAFVEHLVAMKPAFDNLKAAAGSELFPKLTTSLDTLVTNVFPTLEDHLKTTGGLLGDAALGLTRIFESGKKNRLGQVLAGNNAILKIFTQRGKGGENTFSKLERVVLRFLVAINPLTKRFAEWIKHLVDFAEKSTRSENSMKRLTGFFNKAGDVAAQLGRIFKNLFIAIGILGGASKKSGQGLLDSFEKATRKLDKFLQKLRDNGSLQKFFRRAAFNLRALGHLFDLVFVQIARLSNTKASGKFAKSLEPAVKNIGDIGLALEKASPTLGPFVTQLTDIIEQLTQTGQTNTFIKTLTDILKVINKIFHVAEGGNNFVDRVFGINIFKVAGTIFAVHRALAFALVPLKFFGKALIGGPRNAIKAFQQLRDNASKTAKFVGSNFKKMTGFFKTLKSDGFKKAFGDLKKSSDESKTALEKQMEVDELKGKSLKALGKAADKAARKLKEFRDAAAPLAGELEAIGQEAAAGLTLGFETGSDTFIQAMVTLAKESVKAIQVELGIASPSKVFEKIGREAGEGYVIGLESETGAAAAAGSQLGTSSATGAKESSALGGLGSAGGVGATAEKDAAKLEKSGGKMAKLFGGLGKAVGGAVGLFLPFEVALDGIGAAIGAAIVPILLIVAAIAAFVGMFILLYKQSPQFKKFIDGIVGKLKDLGHWFKDVVLPVIVEFAKWIGEKFVNLVVPPINAFFKIVNEVLPKIGHFFGEAFHAIAVFWNTVLHPVLKAIIAVVKFLWKFIIKPYLKLIQLEFKVIFNLIKFYWTHVLKPVINAIIDIIKFLWKNVFKPYFDLILGVVKTVFNAIKQVWDNVLHPVFNAIKTALGDLLNKFQTVFGNIRTVWDNFIQKIRDVKDTIGTIVGKIGDVFSGLGGIIQTAFADAYKFMGRGVNAIIGAINKYLIGGLNAVGGKFGITIDSIPKIPGLAAGGRVRGQGGDKEDNLPHLLSNNEFVIQAASAKKIGYDALEKANKSGELPYGGFSIPHPHIPGFSTIKNLVGDTINGVENIGEKIAKEGLGKVLEKLVHGAESLMQGAGLKHGSYFNDLVYGMMDKIAEAAKHWAGNAGKGVKEKTQATSSGGTQVANIKKVGKWVFPVAGPYTYNSRYTYGSPDGQGGYHTGSDFDAKVGTPLVAMGQGIVRQVTNLGDHSYGRYVTIDYNVFQTLYAHMNAFAAGLSAGQLVKAGTRIGEVGWYGNVVPKSPAGAHLHFEGSTIGKFGSMSNTVNPIELLRRLGFKFARGGVVSPTEGGMLSVIGEAGHHERVEPLDSEGFSKRDRAILDMIQQAIGKRGGDTLIVNPSQGMDEMELAEAVARRMKFRRRTGT